jgi:hypothetical protein
MMVYPNLKKGTDSETWNMGHGTWSLNDPAIGTDIKKQEHALMYNTIITTVPCVT